MSYLKKMYYKACKENFTQLGFVRKKDNIVRVVNDVMQNFCIHVFHGGYSCNVEFGVIPLCSRIKKDDVTLGLCPGHIRAFEGKWDSYEYDKKSEESMDACVNEIIEQMKKYLIPYFDKSCDCASAYQELCKFEMSAWKSILMHDYRKFCMALKSGDYDLAIAHLKAKEELDIKGYKTYKVSEGFPADIKRARLKRIKELQKMIVHIENRDDVFIKNFISENETYSLESLQACKVPVVRAGAM
ncbi:MAG: hypothetical protein FWG87_10675 [Defluviitaleaceae bacterium]|nr:hypothetical protein [Defluviitaleaceae bacterium]